MSVSTARRRDRGGKDHSFPIYHTGGNGVPGVNVLGNYRLRGMHRLRARVARANCVVTAGRDVSHQRALGSVAIAESFVIEREVPALRQSRPKEP